MMLPNVLRNVSYRDDDAAKAFRDARCILRWHLQPLILHLVLPGREVAVIAPLLIVGLGLLGLEGFPSHIERLSSFCEVGGSPGCHFTRPASGIEAAGPLPLIGILRDARALADRSNPNVAIEDGPALKVRVQPPPCQFSPSAG